MKPTFFKSHLKAEHANLATKHIEYFNISSWAQGKNKAILVKNVIVTRSALQSYKKIILIFYNMKISTSLLRNGNGEIPHGSKCLLV